MGVAPVQCFCEVEDVFMVAGDGYLDACACVLKGGNISCWVGTSNKWTSV